MTAERPFRVIGELMNNSFGRARKAWQARDLAGQQRLARISADRGADDLTLYLDGTNQLTVTLDEMLAFLPRLIPAIQEAVALPVSFDNTDIRFHREALRHWDRTRGGVPIVNSLAPSRPQLDEWLALVHQYDTRVIIMASEKFGPRGVEPCHSAADVHESARALVHLARNKARRSNAEIIIDPGLAAVSADTGGLVNRSLDAMRLIRRDPDLAGVHLMVGLTNVAFGMPEPVRLPLCNAYLTLAVEAGLDTILGNPEHDPHLLDAADQTLSRLRAALEAGRPRAGEPQEEAGMRQIEQLMEMY